MIFKLLIFLFFCIYSVSLNASDLSQLLDLKILDGIKNIPFSMNTIIFVFCFTLFPMLVFMVTSFTRIIIILNLLRNAIGMPYLPPNQILFGVSMFLTFFIMSPTIDKIYQDSYIPFSQNKIHINEACILAIRPIHNFMLHQTKKSDLSLFYSLSHIKCMYDKKNIPIIVLLPAFITSELKTAFQIGCIILIPFLIIDLIVASVLISLGMVMVDPNAISLPIKLILFVLIDGWKLIFSSLVHSFY